MEIWKLSQRLRQKLRASERLNDTTATREANPTPLPMSILRPVTSEDLTASLKACNTSSRAVYECLAVGKPAIVVAAKALGVKTSGKKHEIVRRIAALYPKA